MIAERKRLLLVEDDDDFLPRLARAMELRGFAVETAGKVSTAIKIIADSAPDFAVVDMRLGDGNGLEVVEAIKEANPHSKTIILTGYGNLETAVTAIKVGAVDYLAKPADADEIFDALMSGPKSKTKPPENPMDPNEARWQHIQTVLAACGNNISETARRLGMHRRSLQRVIAARAEREPS